MARRVGDRCCWPSLCLRAKGVNQVSIIACIHVAILSFIQGCHSHSCFLDSSLVITWKHRMLYIVSRFPSRRRYTQISTLEHHSIRSLRTSEMQPFQATNSHAEHGTGISHWTMTRSCYPGLSVGGRPTVKGYLKAVGAHRRSQPSAPLSPA